MSPILELTIVCGLLILIPGSTFGVGLWLIISRVGMQHRLASILFAVLMGIVAFEASMIGIAIDPRWNFDWGKLFITSGLIGIATTVFILIFTPIYTRLLKIFNR
jgi:hypothetical protein